MRFPSNWDSYDSIEWVLMALVGALLLLVLGGVLFALVWGPDGVTAVIRALRGV